MTLEGLPALQHPVACHLGWKQLFSTEFFDRAPCLRLRPSGGSLP